MIYDIIIIGGGPAGITAGIYSSRQGLNALLITKEFGGQMAKKTVDIENYPGFPKISGMDLIQKFKEHLRGTGIKIENDKVAKIEKDKDVFSVIIKSGNKFQAKTVIIASGAEPIMLNASGEKEFMGKGVSYCPICDGPLFKNKKVAVVGGGNAAFESAIWLAKYAKEVFLLERNKEVSADKKNQEVAEETGKIKVMVGVDIKEIKGDAFVNSVIYQNLSDKEEKVLEISGVFIEIGYKPATDFAKDLVDLNEKGEIEIDFDTAETKTRGLYAAGDVDKGKCRQIVVACGEGAVAATSAYKYLQNLKA